MRDSIYSLNLQVSTLQEIEWEKILDLGRRIERSNGSKYCRSCIASFMADCAAICCCPCAVGSCSGFGSSPALVFCTDLREVALDDWEEVFGGREKKGHNPEENKRRRKGKDRKGVIKRNANLGEERGVEDDEAKHTENFCVGMEDESVWLEFY
ncbi:hypothetical protein NE237_008052 [Protea cynaroides]|uniref:Uncharacterized protein n=1 Tax=Protea cynaroides TaxID=273540 RepID=A0A9Q0QWS0_9MAGN|nr:hypothetical protein NE237_008052 [Protea cynaroides]